MFKKLKILNIATVICFIAGFGLMSYCYFTGRFVLALVNAVLVFILFRLACIQWRALPSLRKDQ